MVGKNERVVGLRCGVIGSGDPEQERPTPDRLRHELAILAANALDCAVLCGDGVVGESESNARQCRQFGEKVGHHDDRGLFMKSPSFLLYVDEIRRRGRTTMKVVEEGPSRTHAQQRSCGAKGHALPCWDKQRPAVLPAASQHMSLARVSCKLRRSGEEEASRW